MRGETNLPVLGHRVDDVDIGGHTMRCTAAAAVKLGDIVYLSGTRTVNKSTTLSNHKLIVGVVVGGANTEMKYVTDSAQYNVLTVADANELVLIQYSGIAYVIAAAAIAVGVPLIPDTSTAGRVKAAADLAGAAGDLAVSALTVGTLAIAAGAVGVTSTAANGAIIEGAPGGGVLSGTAGLSGDGYFRGVGRLLEASSNAGDIRAALLNIGA